MEWYIKVLTNYSNFDGRARRMEYWMFQLINLLFSLGLLLVGLLLGLGFGAFPFAFISIIYAIGIFIPSIAVTVRRLHDTGKSGWVILLGFIPFVGAIILLVFLLSDSTYGTNQYGPNPKEIDFVK